MSTLWTNIYLLPPPLRHQTTKTTMIRPTISAMTMLPSGQEGGQDEEEVVAVEPLHVKEDQVKVLHAAM